METTGSSLRNGQWVGRYAKGLIVIGILVLVVSIASGKLYFDFYQSFAGCGLWWGYKVASLIKIISSCLTGFLAISLASFLSYALGTRQQPGSVLRFTEPVLYVLAGLGLATFALNLWNTIQMYQNTAARYDLTWMVADIGSTLTNVAGSLIFVALGLVLRRVLPIIEESRTLV